MVRATGDNPYRFVIGGLAVSAQFAGAANFVVVSPVLPLITEDYGISYAAAGLLVGVVALANGAFGIPGGIIAGKLGLWRTIALGWLMMGLLTLSALSIGFGGLLALRILFGLGMGVVFPATGSLVMQWFRGRQLPVINSMITGFASAGMVVAAATAAPLAGVMGWERVLGLFGAIGLVGALAWLVWGRVREVPTSVTRSLTWGDVKSVLSNRTVLLLGFADAALFSHYIALSAWLPTFYHEDRGMSLTHAGFITSLLPFTGIFGVALGGLLPLKMGSWRLFVIVSGLIAGLGGLGCFLLQDLGLIYASVILLGLGAWLYVPTLLTLPMELPGMTPQRIAIAWGWVITVTGIATFISPLVVGALRDTLDSFIPGFLLFGVLAWFLLVAGFLLPKARPFRAVWRRSRSRAA